MSLLQVAPRAPAYDVFTELDPLGTGRSRPYVDKKLFFQELKNPPKKVLKDLVPSHPPPPPAPPERADYGPPTALSSLSRQSGGSVAIARPAADLFSSDPFAETDPFDDADPFESFREDPFAGALDFPRPSEKPELSKEPVLDKRPVPDADRAAFNGPLQVSLPPEPAPRSPRLPRQVRRLLLSWKYFNILPDRERTEMNTVMWVGPCSPTPS